MFGKKMKVYGEDYYKGYLLLKDKKGNVSKHYISDVGGESHSKRVTVWVRSKDGDVGVPYEMGKNHQVDTAVKTWVSERSKQKMRYSNNLHKSCYEFLK